jgi:DNA invertase Pin-like site-specific DNA recombinase
MTDCEVKRIAIYTRKSNDENLNGAVTSIDSQKLACRNYIQIQKEKGWVEYPEPFDDPAESAKA